MCSNVGRRVWENWQRVRILVRYKSYLSVLFTTRGTDSARVRRSGVVPYGWMTVPGSPMGALDDVDDRLDALRSRLTGGSDFVRRVREHASSPDRIASELTKLGVDDASASMSPRDTRPPRRPRRTEPVDHMPSPAVSATPSATPASPRSPIAALNRSRRTTRRSNAYNTTPVLTSPGGGRERAPAYGSPARFGIVPNSPAPSRGVLAGGDELRHQHSHHHSHSHSHARRDVPGSTSDSTFDGPSVTMTVRERDELHAQLVRLTEERDARRGECERTKRTLTETKVQLDRAESKYADVTTRLDAVVEDLAAHRARVGSNSGGGEEGAGVHPALAGATADMRVQASELRAALDDLMSIADPGGALKLADTGQARAVRERTRALIARAEDVAVAAMGAVESGAERAFVKAAGTNGQAGRRFKLPIY